MARGNVVYSIFHLTLMMSIVLTSALKTLNNEQQLWKSGFGRPPPHNGIILLKWYVKTCLNKKLVALCDPSQGKYGFHKFMNHERLLPVIKYTNKYQYYTIGNLHCGKDLPDEVKKYYNPKVKESNADRVLVRYNNVNREIPEMYASTHYRANETFKIGHKLIKALQRSGALVSIEMSYENLSISLNRNFL